MTAGIHLLHKPAGPTSFSVVRQWTDAARAEATMSGRKPPKICHGGTLDPFASGLLLILVGRGTKLFDHLHAVPKVYEGTIRWGIETDNGDPLGRVVQTGDTSTLSPDRLDAVLSEFIGWREQIPPTTSARRIGGERAYVRAHRGEQFEMPAMRVYMHEAQWLGHELSSSAPSSRFRIVVRGGYYVRALARDLGRTIGCSAHLSELSRASIGPWQDPEPGQSIEITGRALLPWLESRVLSDQEIGELRAGRTIPTATIDALDWLLPTDFPGEADPPVRGFHQGRLAWLLKRTKDLLIGDKELIGGL
jgi:tRNA pseudouridine55 synthase